MKIEGNTMLVTGGGSGIGEALAHRFHDRGDTVIVTRRRRDALEKAAVGRANMIAMPRAGTAEREAALSLIDRHRSGRRRVTLGADKAYDVAAFVADLRSRRITPHYLDLCGPATLVVRSRGDGEIAFGALRAGLDVDYGPDETGFTWQGRDEMDEVSGAGSAELQADGSLQIEFKHHNGDEAVLKAVRERSSTACWTEISCARCEASTGLPRTVRDG